MWFKNVSASENVFDPKDLRSKTSKIIIVQKISHSLENIGGVYWNWEYIALPNKFFMGFEPPETSFRVYRCQTNF